MWFKQIQLFQLTESMDLSINHLMEKLAPLAFRPCLPSMEVSSGWISPVDSEDENAPLVRSINGYMMLCLQVEEKILPAAVIRHELANKIKKIEKNEDRKIYQKEKLTLKDEMKMNLLPRAFSKFTKLYAYIDIRNRRMIIGSANAKKTELFLNLFKKSGSENISAIEVNKLSPVMTHWIQHQNYPSAFSIEKSAILQDPNQKNRIIRCQQQDLFAASIQSLIKDGCVIKQIAANWQDRLSFVLSDDFILKNLKYQDEVIAAAKEMEPETREQQFDADFLIMTDMLTQLIDELLIVFIKKPSDETIHQVVSLIKTA